MSKEALGSGLKFPIRTNVRGGLAVSQYEEKVRESIRTILATAKGERLMRPEFGCGIHDYTFATLDSTNLTLIRSAVREALVQWEPRIELIEVEVDTRNAREGQLLLNVAYKIRMTNVQANLVYPFYLESSA
jgi:phage baseplate assembly protein W